MSPWNRALTAAALVLAAFALGAAATAQDPAPDVSDALSAQARRALEAAAPATLGLTGTREADRTRRSATLVKPDLAITDASNLLGMPDRVVLTTHDGRRIRGRLIAQDFRLRVAALRLEAEDGAPATLEGALEPARDLRVGRFAISCGRGEVERGAPQGTLGIVSASERFSGRALQVSCDLNLGSSGGPVVDLDGRAYGIAVVLPQRIAFDCGVGFVVPWRAILEVLPRLEAGEDVYPASLGLMVPDEEVAGLPGVPIVDVRPDGAAAKAGLKKGDIILSVDEVPTPQLKDLARIAKLAAAGDALTLRVQRGEARLSVRLTADRLDPR